MFILALSFNENQNSRMFYIRAFVAVFAVFALADFADNADF